jgi:tRNA threonylcarbamoyladenosine biosynthesis protein TsaE
LHGTLEVDDLDLDATLGESVTVVEWGEGLVEGLAQDRLDVEISRPVGSGAPDPGSRGDEPRTIRLRGVGERWAGSALPALV